MSPILLGSGVGKPVHLDMAKLMVSRMLVQANSGSGKSWALRRILEQSFGQVPQVVIDVDDEFHTLREKYSYVLVGAAGSDCRADPRTASLLARRILEHGFSAIVTIHELRMQDRKRFVRLFLETLIDAPRALWRPLLVVVDEAHIFCPEKDQAESAGAVNDLMTRGRKRGFCGLLATQRISKLSKDAAAEANNKLIGRSALDVDMKRSADELGFTGREDQHRLRTLEPGQFFAFGPAIAPRIELVKVGEVKTTHPEPGARGRAATPPAPEKLRAILAKLADLPKDAEAEEGELERLRREVFELRRKLGAGGVREESAAAAISVAMRDGTERGRAEGYRQALAAVAPIAERLGTLRSAFVEQVDAFRQDLQRLSRSIPAAQNTPILPKAAQKPAQAPQRPPEPRSAQRRGNGDASLSGGQQRILDALAWLETIRPDPASKTQLALLADQSPKSSGYANNLGALRSSGLIDYPSPGTVCLTDEGRSTARAPARAPSTEDLHRTLEAKLPRPQWRILQAAIELYPASGSKEAIAERADQSVTSSGFANNLGALRSLGFIDYPRPGSVAARPELFLEARG